MNKIDSTSTQIIRLKGNHYQMGYQHGQQVAWLRPYIIHAVEARLAQIAGDRPDESFAALVQETAQVLQTADPATLDFIRGQADSLGLDFEWLLNYSLVSFLRDALTTRRAQPAPAAGSSGPAGECTTWAARAPITADGQPILVKNRDYFLEHLPLQMIAQAEPAAGYGYVYVTSAGNPGVFVAGLNEAGLAVADTHVPCSDVGPGLPTFALSMYLLEEHPTVASALSYLQSVPRLGRNNLILADAAGQLAVFENGHRRSAVLQAENGYLIATNHFNSTAMKDCFVDTEPPALRGNTFARYDKVRAELTAAHGRVDVALAQELMTSHDGPLASLCRHPLPESNISTISTTILLPARREIHFCHGQPCQSQFQIFNLSSEN